MNVRSVPRSSSRTHRLLLLAAIVLTVPLWAMALVVVLLVRACRLVVLYAVVWTWWMGRARRRVLFVYSDSPHWKEHVETHILPQLPGDSVVLNWSQRASWNPFNAAVLLFRGFAGEQAFNPCGLVFERFRTVKRYRFFHAFRDATHGRPDALHGIQKRFLEHVTD